LGHVEGIWRVMLAICALPALALFFGMIRVPESPRWLMAKGRREDALSVLKELRAEDRAIAEIDDIAQQISASQNEARIGFGSVVRDRFLRRILLVGIGLGVIQQLTGINSIMYYGQIVLIESGFEANAVLIANIA